MMYYIDLKQLPTIDKEIEKLKEEIDEFSVEIINKNISGILEEGLDVIQAAIHVMMIENKRLPKYVKKYKDIKIKDEPKEFMVKRLNVLSKNFANKRYYITFIALITRVLRTFKAYGISKELLEEEIEKHNLKLKNRGWALVRIKEEKI